MRCRGTKICFILLLFTSFVYVSFVLVQRNDDIPHSFEDCINECLVKNHVAKNINEGIKKDTINPWKICPAPGEGQQTFVTAKIHGRLGNVVWSYLTVLAAAKRHKLRPALQESNITVLAQYFTNTSLKIPSLQWLDKQCNMDGWLENGYKNDENVLGSREILFTKLEATPKEGNKLLFFGYYATNTEELVPYWNELKNELELKGEYTAEAFRRLKNIIKKHQDKDKIKIDRVEFVGVHVRRTDYEKHFLKIFPGSEIASPKFFHNAMNWMRQKLNKCLIFVVVSDDNEWAQKNIVANRTDTYLGGDGLSKQPGADLALLAACNHTIFAYGTFGLTGALLANNPGGYTIIFDPLNGTVTKEMELGANLPRWRIMDGNGNFNYENSEIKYRYYL